MSNGRIRLATSIPGLKDKIQVDISGDSDDVLWYIRFNIPLNENSVSHKTMNVMDTEGYIMRTDISYNKEKNMIVISPIDSYEQNTYYLLNISKKVKSEKGRNLRSKIHILFKLLDNQISEFKVLKSTVKVPKPKPRPRNYEQKISKSKVYSFETDPFSNVPQDKLPTAKIRVNLIMAVIGLLLLGCNFILQNFYLWFASFAGCAIGAGILIVQLTRGKQRSILAYNRGARHFNNERYEKADKYFKLALSYDSDNEMAEYALNKVSFYL